MLQTNAHELIAMAVSVSVSQPALRHPGYVPDNSGVATGLPGMAGVLYNIRAHYPCRRRGFRVGQGAGTRAPIAKRWGGRLSDGD